MTSSAVPVGVHPESVFHVAVKTGDLDDSETFYREHLDAEVDNSEVVTAVNHVALDVANKLISLSDETPHEAAGIVDDVSTGVLLVVPPSPTSTPHTTNWRRPASRS